MGYELTVFIVLHEWMLAQTSDRIKDRQDHVAIQPTQPPVHARHGSDIALITKPISPDISESVTEKPRKPVCEFHQCDGPPL